MLNTLAEAGIAFVESDAEGRIIMTALVTPLFWNQKLKIAILTLATFAALC
jgi:hypothetical protein